MTAINNTEVKDALCKNCGCNGFVPGISYVINATARTVQFTEASTFPATDNLKALNLHVSDAKGNKKSKQITVAAANTTFSAAELLGFDFSDLTLTATVVTNGGCKADLGVHNVGASQLTGSLGSVNDQGDTDTNN